MFVAVAGPAWAEPEVEREAPGPGDVVDLVSLTLAKGGVRAYTEETISLLADFGPADATELRTTLGLRVGGPVSDVLALRMVVSGNLSYFLYDGDRSELAADLSPSRCREGVCVPQPSGGAELFDELYDTQLGVGGSYKLTEHWSVFAEGRTKLSWEDGASLSDAIKGSGAVGVGFELDERLDLALGIEVGSSLDSNGVKVQPVFGFRWQFRDDMRLESQGIGLAYRWDMTPELELQLRARYDTDTYRLDGRGTVLGAPTLRQREVPLLVALRWSPSLHWRLSAGAGSVVYQQWKVENEHGGDSSSVSAGPAPLGWIRIEYRF